METPRNKGRAPGMIVLGIPMPQALKQKIQAAAELQERKMADWARIELRKAAEAILAEHEQKKHPSSTIAPAEIPLVPLSSLRVADEANPDHMPSKGHTHYRTGKGKSTAAS